MSKDYLGLDIWLERVSRIEFKIWRDGQCLGTFRKRSHALHWVAMERRRTRQRKPRKHQLTPRQKRVLVMMLAGARVLFREGLRSRPIAWEVFEDVVYITLFGRPQRALRAHGLIEPAFEGDGKWYRLTEHGREIASKLR